MKTLTSFQEIKRHFPICITAEIVFMAEITTGKTPMVNLPTAEIPFKVLDSILRARVRFPTKKLTKKKVQGSVL